MDVGGSGFISPPGPPPPKISANSSAPLVPRGVAPLAPRGVFLRPRPPPGLPPRADGGCGTMVPRADMALRRAATKPPTPRSLKGIPVQYSIHQLTAAPCTTPPPPAAARRSETPALRPASDRSTGLQFFVWARSAPSALRCYPRAPVAWRRPLTAVPAGGLMLRWIRTCSTRPAWRAPKRAATTRRATAGRRRRPGGSARRRRRPRGRGRLVRAAVWPNRAATQQASSPKKPSRSRRLPRDTEPGDAEPSHCCCTRA